jgi:transcriptional regulator with XRE-family HTH domain
MSLKAYADIIHVTRQTASSYIAGEYTIDSEKLYITANFFNKALSWFYEKEHTKPQFTHKDIEQIIESSKKMNKTILDMKEVIKEWI